MSVFSYGGITRIRFTGYNLSPFTVWHPFQQAKVERIFFNWKIMCTFWNTL